MDMRVHWYLFTLCQAINVQHPALPLVKRNSLIQFRAASLNPKRCLVFSNPRTGISSTRNNRLSIDGSVSTPLRIRQISWSFSFSSSVGSHRRRFLAFIENVTNAVRTFIFALHSSQKGQPSHWLRSKETRTLPVFLL